MSEFDFVLINKTPLKPAPYVSTTYEYKKSGEFIIGGVLIVTLSGTLVGEDILDQMASLREYNKPGTCIELIIGCSGNDDFLNGNGKVRALDIADGNEPFVASYTMQIAIETIKTTEGTLDPSVKPQQEFLEKLCLPPNDEALEFLQDYEETITFQGEASVFSSVDSFFKVSKSFVKANGRISISHYSKDICGKPTYNGAKKTEDLLKLRAKKLISFDFCSPTHPLSQYKNWNKWLDSRSVEITSDGVLTWTFDLYMNNSFNITPLAWVDINTDDSMDLRTNRKTRSINGTIKGLSAAVLVDPLGHKATSNERISNAEKAYGLLVPKIINGDWAGSFGSITGKENCGTTTQPCQEDPDPVCYQRQSSSATKSPINGEISFSAQFTDISVCDNLVGDSIIDYTIDESMPTVEVQEIIIPNNGRSVVQKVLEKTARTVTITVRGKLQSCDKGKTGLMIGCVNQRLKDILDGRYGTWLLKRENKNLGLYSFTITQERILCCAGDYGVGASDLC